MSTLDRDMIKQAVSELVDKVIDSRIGGAENFEVSCLKKFLVNVLCYCVNILRDLCLL